MEIKVLPVGRLQANCYLVSDGGDAVLIDPGDEAGRILAAVRARGVHVLAILLTHGHFDHVGAVRPVAEALRCPVWLHEAELSVTPRMTNGPLYYTDSYDEGDTVRFGALSFTVLHTPGHSPGSVCLRCADVLFSGDTLFACSCGRTDFPGGSPADMAASLRRLAAITDDLTVYPGHGEQTTLALERRMNPYFRA